MKTNAKTVLLVTAPCSWCNQLGEVRVPVLGLVAYRCCRVPVQDAFPDLDRGLREQVKSGIHPECFEKMFGPHRPRRWFRWPKAGPAWRRRRSAKILRKLAENRGY